MNYAGQPWLEAAEGVEADEPVYVRSGIYLYADGCDYDDFAIVFDFDGQDDINFVSLLQVWIAKNVKLFGAVGAFVIVTPVAGIRVADANCIHDPLSWV